VCVYVCAYKSVNKQLQLQLVNTRQLQLFQQQLKKSGMPTRLGLGLGLGEWFRRRRRRRCRQTDRQVSQSVRQTWLGIKKPLRNLVSKRVNVFFFFLRSKLVSPLTWGWRCGFVLVLCRWYSQYIYLHTYVYICTYIHMYV